MALLDSEVARIKLELGWPLLDTANPVFGVSAVFEQVIQAYMGAGAKTTATTSVSAASEPTLATLTLASSTGFTAGDRIIVDVDERQEGNTVRVVSGATVNLLLSLEHSGTYPVTVEGGEAIVREILGRIRETKVQMAESSGTGALKRAEDAEWYNSGSSEFGSLGNQLMTWRDELAVACGGIELNRWRSMRGGSQTLSVY